MSDEANVVIDGLGGTTAVARMLHAPISTVHSWRKNGIPPSRLAHLKLVAQLEGLAWPEYEADAPTPSPGKSDDFAAPPAHGTPPPFPGPGNEGSDLAPESEAA